MILNQSTLATLTHGFVASFKSGFAGAAPLWQRVATLVPSSTKTNDYSWLGQFPRLREWLGDRHIKNISQFSYSITNKKFEATIAVKRDDIDDDQYGIYGPLFQEMGHSAATHPDELVFALLAAAFTTPCYDGQNFIDTDHPVGDGFVSNSGGGSGAAWFLLDTSRPLKPLIFQKRRDYALKSFTDPNEVNVFMRDEYLYGTDARANVGFGFWQMAYGSKATLDATNFAAALKAMELFQSDEGNPLGIKPNLLVVGPTSRAAAKALIEVDRLANGASNPNYKAVEVLVVPWLG